MREMTSGKYQSLDSPLENDKPIGECDSDFSDSDILGIIASMLTHTQLMRKEWSQAKSQGGNKESDR